MTKRPSQLVIKWKTYQWGCLLFRSGTGRALIPTLIFLIAIFFAVPSTHAEATNSEATTSSTNKLAKPDASMLVAEIAPEIAPVTEADNNQLSSQVAETIAPLMSVKLKLGWNNYHGPSLPGQPDSATGGQVQMAIPFSVFNQPNLMRVTTPFQFDGRGDDGFSRVTVFDLLAFSESWGRWGVGPVMSVDTTGQAADRFVLGPAVGVSWNVSKKLKLGLLSQNVFWSNTSRSFLQPIIGYQLGNGWALSSGDLQFTYDWEKGRWINVPIGFQISKVIKLGQRQPISFGLSQQYNLLNTTGQKGYSISFSVTFLFPTLGHHE